MTVVDHKLYDILMLLSVDEYQTAQNLADKLSLSEKTVRTRIKSLNEELANYGAQVISKQRYGYILEVSDAQKFVQVSYDRNQHEIPENTEERQQYLLFHLLHSKKFMKLDDLSEKLYISRKTLSANLKRVEEIAQLYHIKLERRPNYGIALKGSEFDFRNCLVDHSFEMFQDEVSHEWLIQMVFAGNQQNNVKMTEIALDSFVKYILVSMDRMQHHFQIQDKQTPSAEISSATQTIIDEYADKIEKQFKIKFDAMERTYLAIQFSSRLSSDSYSQYGPNFIITGQIDELVFRMLNTIYETFSLDFRNNLELRMSLNQHLVPMDIRIRYNIRTENPLLDEIKKEYAYPYTLALTACLCLKEYYHKEIPESEIAYIAIIFALATEKRNRVVQRKNIVLVCISGKSSSQLFKYKYQQAFGQYINEIYECTVAELDQFDFKANEIDYIFTTVPLTKKYPVPIYEINLFIDANDILVYQEMFENGDSQQVINYFSTNLFTPHLKARTREEVLMQMCAKITHYHLAPNDFFEAVMKRENMGQTDFGNMVAIPHPYKVISEESFVSVAILDKPIIWNKNEVQVVFLLSVGLKEDSALENFYQKIVDIVFDAKAIQSLIHEPTFAKLVEIVTKK